MCTKMLRFNIYDRDKLYPYKEPRKSNSLPMPIMESYLLLLNERMITPPRWFPSQLLTLQRIITLLKVVNSIETPLDIHWRIVFCSNFEFNTLIDDSVLIFGDTMQHQAIESAVNINIGIEDDHPNIENFRECKPLLRHWLPRNMPGDGGQRVRRYQ